MSTSPDSKLPAASTFTVIARELKLKVQQVQQTAALLQEGNTIPFITRYRREVTGGLDEELLRQVRDQLELQQQLTARKQFIQLTITRQGKWNSVLAARLNRIETGHDLEDFYQPFKSIRRSREQQALAAGLHDAAVLLWCSSFQRSAVARDFKGEVIADLDSGVDRFRRSPGQTAALFADATMDPAAALSGTIDIVAAWIAATPIVRQELRRLLSQRGKLESNSAGKDSSEAGRSAPSQDAAKFQHFHDYCEPVTRIPPHRLLALNRGEKLGFLRVKLVCPELEPVEQINRILRATGGNNPLRDQAVTAAWQRLLAPALERDIRRLLNEYAWKHSYQVYGRNLRQLLLQPPLPGKVIMGIDPGFRSGCKVAVVDETGRYLTGSVIYPHPPQLQRLEAKLELAKLVENYQVDCIAIGNGTASRETEEVVGELIEETGVPVVWTIVSEAGASVYSVSEVAREEFPDLDAGQRGNISIARRLLDPLSELIKVDPRSLGVGQYQHDADQKELQRHLEEVVEEAVSSVGVDLNSASAQLLQYVAGLNRRTAAAIVARRDSRGPFTNRTELREVPGIGNAAFQQAAGFLRIVGGTEPLDDTAIHPESYPVVARLQEIAAPNSPGVAPWLADQTPAELIDLAGRLAVGLPTLTDIATELRQPGRDRRHELPGPLFRKDVIALTELHPGMSLPGTVRNLVDFGAFVDIGVKVDGLLHLSQMGGRGQKHPLDLMSVGDLITVEILQVDRERGRISLKLVEGDR